MDSLITAAAYALARGDALGALKRVALRDDAAALALRGIAMAQLGEFDRAKTLLRRAARAFGTHEAMARARCVVAEAEIALVSRDLAWPTQALEAARATLEAHGDRVNAAHARYLAARRALLLGDLARVEQMLAGLDPAHLPPALNAVHELIVAGVAMRRVHARAARQALARAQRAALASGIGALDAEIAGARAVLDAPAAHVHKDGVAHALTLDDIERLFASRALVIDACRYAVRDAHAHVALARRPVLFALLRALAAAWPQDVSRDALVAAAFRGKRADESYRARLRVEIGRLRKALAPLAGVHATARGFVLAPVRAPEVVVLAQPLQSPHADVLALLADGEWWSSSSLALVLATGQRTMQRALETLAAAGQVQSIGRGRARRWMTPPLPAFATALLLPAALPLG